MSKLFAVKVLRTITMEATVIVRAADKHEAADKADDFAKANDINDRYAVRRRELSVYSADIEEVYRAAHVDIEA